MSLANKYVDRPNNTNPWFLCPKPNSRAKVRLFCLPFAGGGASTYNGWQSSLPDEIELRLVQPPGRESRFAEPCITDWQSLVEHLADAIHPYLDRPFAFFGYSTGALLAFELSRKLRRRELPIPEHLFLAAAKAPQSPSVHPPLAELPEAELLASVRYYYQPPETAWNVPELRELLLPILRSDLAIGDNYRYSSEPPLPCPMDVLVGERDSGAPLDAAAAWQAQTSASFDMSIFPGGHFFLSRALKDVQQLVRIRMVALLENSYGNKGN